MIPRVPLQTFRIRQWKCEPPWKFAHIIQFAKKNPPPRPKVVFEGACLHSASQFLAVSVCVFVCLGADDARC